MNLNTDLMVNQSLLLQFALTVELLADLQGQARWHLLADEQSSRIPKCWQECYALGEAGVLRMAEKSCDTAITCAGCFLPSMVPLTIVCS